MKLTVIFPVHDHDTFERDLASTVEAFANCETHLVCLFSSTAGELLVPYAARSYTAARDMLAEQRATTAEAIDSSKRIFDGYRPAPGSSSEWREAGTMDTDDLALHALFADIVVLPGRTRGEGQKNQGFDYPGAILSHLVVNTPCSVLLLPEEDVTAPVFANPVFAWKASPESSMAAKELVRFLPPGSSLKTVTIAPKSIEGIGSWSAAEITQYLQRSGVQVEDKIVVLKQGTVAQAIDDYAKSVDASLIVAGGYGRQRWLETLLGGVTQGLLRDSRKPVLFAH